MKPFMIAEYDKSPEGLQARAAEFGCTVGELLEQLEGIVAKNDQYQVCVRRHGQMAHLSIKRLDREPIHDWRDLQEIKNQIVGPEFEAVELYPAESRLVDSANQYHLWAVLDPNFRFPFGFTQRSVSEVSLGGSKQRPLTNKEPAP